MTDIDDDSTLPGGPAATEVGRSLQWDFGADRTEVLPMIQVFEAPIHALGHRGEGAINDWLRREGIDPDSIWRQALEHIRAVPLLLGRRPTLH